jgi:hypothetical protein
MEEMKTIAATLDLMFGEAFVAGQGIHQAHWLGTDRLGQATFAGLSDSPTKKPAICRLLVNTLSYVNQKPFPVVNA